MAGTKGRSGRKREPTQRLKLMGTYRADRRSPDEPRPDIGAPSPPKWITGEARKEWERIVPLLLEQECVTRWDRAALVLYVQEWQRYVVVQQKLRMVKNLLVPGSRGNQVPHGLLKLNDRIFSNLLRVCTEFGLTPSARSHLRVEAESHPLDPLQELLQRRIKHKESPHGA